MNHTARYLRRTCARAVESQTATVKCQAAQINSNEEELVLQHQPYLNNSLVKARFQTEMMRDAARNCLPARAALQPGTEVGGVKA